MDSQDSVFVITLSKKMSTRPPDRLERRVSWFSTICAINQATFKFFDEVMAFPGVSQPESNDYFPPLVKNRIAFGHVFFNLFSIIAFWYARKMRAVILYNLREKSAANLKFWWSYGNFSPAVSTLKFPSKLLLGRVVINVNRGVFTTVLEYSTLE